MPITNSQLDTITRTVLGEAMPNDPSGQAAVAWVIQNRANSGSFPSDPASVATQGNSNGIHQFSAWNTSANEGNNLVNIPATDPRYQQVAAVVRGVFDGSVPDPTNGATYYHTPAVNPTWDNTMTQTAQLGGHIFYSPHPVPPANVPNVAPTPADMTPKLRDAYVQPEAPVPETMSPGLRTPATPGLPASPSLDMLNQMPFSYGSAAPNSSGSPADRDKTPSPVPSIPDPYKPNAGPFSYTTPPSSVVAPNSSGSPSDRDQKPGVTQTAGGIAGTVQLPAGVRPNVAMPSASPAPFSYSTPPSSNGGYTTPPSSNGGYTTPPSSSSGYKTPPSSGDGYSTPPVSGPLSYPSPPTKSTAPQFIDKVVESANPAYTKPVPGGLYNYVPPDIKQIMNAVPISGIGSPGYKPPAPPPKTVLQTIKVANPAYQPQQAIHIVAPPAVQQPIASTNGYTYLPDGKGGYVKAGVVNPALSPSQQYAAASGPIGPVGGGQGGNPTFYVTNNGGGGGGSLAGN